jgi:hypothetical protein
MTENIRSVIRETQFKTLTIDKDREVRIDVKNGLRNAGGYTAVYGLTGRFQFGIDMGRFGLADNGTGVRFENGRWIIVLPPAQLLNCSIRINTVAHQWWTVFTPSTMGPETRKLAEYDGLITLRDGIATNELVLGQVQQDAQHFFNGLLMPVVTKGNWSLDIDFAKSYPPTFDESCIPPIPACFRHNDENWEWVC